MEVSVLRYHGSLGFGFYSILNRKEGRNEIEFLGLAQSREVS